MPAVRTSAAAKYEMYLFVLTFSVTSRMFSKDKDITGADLPQIL